MLVIKIDLIQNRYHANPWNRAHVEGIVEWPPSPWRLLRAILAGGFAAKVDEDDLKSLVGVLTHSLPSYYLPQGAYQQTRSPRKDLTGDTNLIKPGKDIVDACLNFDESDRTIWVHWKDIELSNDQNELLAQCIAYCRYMGRRESDAVWTITKNQPPALNARPDPKGTIRVACSDQNVDDLLKSAYQALALELRSSPPGLIWQNYYVAQPFQQQPSFASLMYHRAELSIRTKGKPRAESALLWADKLHQYLVRRLQASNFTGCDSGGKPLLTHDHVFFQPVIDSGVLKGFTLDSHKGFSIEELEVLQGLTHIWVGKSDAQVRVVNLSPDFGVAAQVWESETPFFLTRFPLTRKGKPRLIPGTLYQKDGPEHQALKALCYLSQFDIDPKNCVFQAHEHGLSMILDGDVISVVQSKSWIQSGRWKTERKHGRKTLEQGFWLRLQFLKPVSGPIGLGYSAHYGLGCLRPQEDSQEFAQRLAM